MKTSHRHASQITPGRLVLLVESPSLRRGVMSGHVYLSIISTGYSVHGGLLMCDHGCDGFPSLDLVGNPSTQVSIIFMYLLLCSYIYTLGIPLPRRSRDSISDSVFGSC